MLALKASLFGCFRGCCRGAVQVRRQGAVILCYWWLRLPFSLMQAVGENQPHHHQSRDSLMVAPDARICCATSSMRVARWDMVFFPRLTRHGVVLSVDCPLMVTLTLPFITMRPFLWG